MPDLFHKAVFEDEPAAFAEQKGERIEIATAHVEPLDTTEEQAFAGIEREITEAKAARGHFSVLPHVMLMPLILAGAKIGASSRPEDNQMSGSSERTNARARLYWRIARWTSALALLLTPLAMSKPSVRTASPLVPWQQFVQLVLWDVGDACEDVGELGLRVTKPSATNLTEITRLVEEDRVGPRIDTILPFGHVKEALARSESGHARGKIVLSITD